MSRCIKFQSSVLRRIAIQQNMRSSTTLLKDSKMYKTMLDSVKLVKLDIAMRASVLSLAGLATELLNTSEAFMLPELISGCCADDEDGG